MESLSEHLRPRDASHRDFSYRDNYYEEVKRIVVFALVFFFGAVVMILFKLQKSKREIEVPAEEVFKWSPIIWLLGVLFWALVMNLFHHCRKAYHRRSRLRFREQQALLYSLQLPASFPCLAPPPHDRCCRARNTLHAFTLVSMPPDLPPDYQQVCKPEAPGVPPPSYESAMRSLSVDSSSSPCSSPSTSSPPPPTTSSPT